MSGYLARLIAHAKVPPAGIRPIARPLFAPAPNSSSATPLAEEAVELSTGQPQGGSIAQPASMLPAPARLAADRSSLDRSAFDPSPFDWRSATDQRHGSSRVDDDGRSERAFAPLMPMREERLERSAEMPSERASESATRPAPEAMGPRVQDVSRTTAIQPLMPVPASRPRLTAVPPPAAPPPMDEVQIHIGRIEINAVPPASPRPATRAPHRGVSLDEYLRKGKGSAR